MLKQAQLQVNLNFSFQYIYNYLIVTYKTVLLSVNYFVRLFLSIPALNSHLPILYGNILQIENHKNLSLFTLAGKYNIILHL